MSRDSTAGYAENADALAVQYESLTFDRTHRDVMHLMPPAPSRVLDIGAGTGRDAAGLARLGHAVVAAEPTAEMRAHGQRLHADAAIEWVDDSLPDLPVLRASGRQFDLIMLTAVWMHLDEQERSAAMASLAALAAPGAAIVMSLRHGPVPEGRRMFDVSGEETRALAARHGLSAIYDAARKDSLRRDGVHWTVLGFRRDA